VKVNAESLEVEETALSLDDDTATLRDVAAFTADVNLQTVYWLDAVSRKMWRTTLTSSHHSLVCYCYLLFVHVDDKNKTRLTTTIICTIKTASSDQ